MVTGEASVPFARSQAGPSRRMCGTLARVSTLFTRVGLSSGGVANGPLDVRPDGPRERRDQFLDDLFQPGLLSEEVEVGAEDVSNRVFASESALHLLQAQPKRLGLGEGTPP